MRYFKYFDDYAHNQDVLASDFAPGLRVNQIVGAGGYPKYTTGAGIHGPIGFCAWRYVAEHQAVETDTTATRQRLRLYLRARYLNSTGNLLVIEQHNAVPEFPIRMEVDGAGAFVFLDAAGGEIGRTAAFGANHLVRVEHETRNDPPTVTTRLWTTDPDSYGAPDYTFTAASSASLTQVRWGGMFNYDGAIDVDSIALADDGGYIGPLASDVAARIGTDWTATAALASNPRRVASIGTKWRGEASMAAGLTVVPATQLAADWRVTAALHAPLGDPLPVPIATDWTVTATLSGLFNVRALAATNWRATATLDGHARIKRVAAAAQWSATTAFAATPTYIVALRAGWTVTATFTHVPIENVYRPPEYTWFLPTTPDERRILAQEILSGEWLDMDAPIGAVEYTRQLCGPTVISGLIKPETPRAITTELEAGAVWLHVEDQGHIMCSGMLQPGQLDGPEAKVEAEGFSGYAHGIPYRDEFTLASAKGIGVQIDPLDVVREGWRHIQSYADGNLGVIVDDTTSPVRIGEEKRDVEFTTGAGEQVEFTAGPYTLDYWENPLIGQEIDKLAVETPFEYVEYDYWNADKTDVIHQLALAYPRIGRKRADLHFEQGRNITSMLPFAENEEYASEVIVTGRGEGRASVWGSAMTRRGRRVRQVHLENDKTITSKRRASAIAGDILGVYSPIYEIKEIEVLAHHSDAPMGTYDVGDDIYVQGEVAYLGDIALWHRIVTLKPSFTTGTVILGLMRTERFIYGPMGQAALMQQTVTGQWLPPNSIEGTPQAYSGPRVRDEQGNWVPIG